VIRISILFLLVTLPLAAQGRGPRYALILEDPPVAKAARFRKDLRNEASLDRQNRILQAQSQVRSALAERNIRVAGATQVLLNAIYVAGDAGVADLSAIAGVRRVVRMDPLKRHLDRALDVMNVRRAWDQVGGEANAGAGIKIAILDTGVDHTHPGLRDNSLPNLPGFPKGPAEYRSFTNQKVIVARSYVSDLVFRIPGDPNDSRPDDLSPRDRVGHGTAVAMIAAGVRNTGPLATITGVAPGARIGNYKIFGSPGVNDFTYPDVIIRALEDAVADGMDIAVVSDGSPALWGPSDSGAVCGAAASEACDASVEAVQNAVNLGLTVVVSAGNDGDQGVKVPTLNSLHSPGTAPGAITVGAITNSHQLFYGVRVTGGNVPSDLARIKALLGNGPTPASPLTAPMRDVSKFQGNGLACSSLPAGSMAGAIAFLQRGGCAFTVKVNNAQKAGAVGAVIYQLEGSNFLFPPEGLEKTGIPAMFIGNTDGKSLKTFLETNPNREVTLDPALQAVDARANQVAYFSSLGPAIGENAIKPEVVAVGVDIYTATQNIDPSGDMYDATGYTTAQGTSFAVPFIAGAAAVLKQQNQGLTPADIKSKIVNTANEVLTDFDESGRAYPARVQAIGAGKLILDDALRSTVTINPATLSLGAVSGGQLPSRDLTFKNLGSSTVTLTFTITPRDRPEDRSSIVINPSPVVLQPNSTRQVTVRLQGTAPRAGQYEGVISVAGAAINLRIPYLYVVGDGMPYNLVPLAGLDFEGIVNTPLTRLALKVIDRYGVPVSRVPVRFRAVLGGGQIESATETTDSLGIAEAHNNRVAGQRGAILGPQAGEQEFVAEAGGLSLSFIGLARQVPTFQSADVRNAASGAAQPLAPGSYISIFGRDLAPALRSSTTPSLAYSLAGTSVSFDVQGKLSVPGRLHFVSEGQINVQIPWELQGEPKVLMKVSVGNFSSQLAEIRFHDSSPALFEYTESSSGHVLAAALDANFGLLGTNNAARRGEAIQLYANGLGPVDNQPASGEPAQANPLSRTRATPEVTIGGQPAEVLFSGLAPSFVGLYQVNVRVAAGTPTGIQPVVVKANGVESKPVNVPVQ
jgi:uncharacterized protein (TIGR03437 family)